MKTTMFSKVIDIMDYHIKKDPEVGKAIFDKFIRDCHPFMFTRVKEITDVLTTDEPLDVPFPCISIELLDGNISVPKPGDEMNISICSFFVREVAPRELEYMTYQRVDSGPEAGEYMLVLVDKVQHPDAWACFNGILKYYLERLKVEKMGLESKGTKRKLGSGKNKEFYRPHGFIHVTPKKHINNVNPTEPGKTINWNHAWEVRGHWREKKGIGKDRSGNYCVKGFTWISAHARGEGPLIKKTYVVNSKEV